VSFAAVTLRVASQRVFIIVIVYFMTQSGNFWTNLHTKSRLRGDVQFGRETTVELKARLKVTASSYRPGAHRMQKICNNSPSLQVFTSPSI
jgi:hypothetical protein